MHPELLTQGSLSPVQFAICISDLGGQNRSITIRAWRLQDDFQFWSRQSVMLRRSLARPGDDGEGITYWAEKAKKRMTARRGPERARSVALSDAEKGGRGGRARRRDGRGRRTRECPLRSL